MLFAYRGRLQLSKKRYKEAIKAFSEAIKFLEFLASPRGSKGIAAPTFEHPLKEVNQNPTVQNFGGFTPDKVTVQQLGEYNSQAIKLMKSAGWD